MTNSEINTILFLACCDSMCLEPTNQGLERVKNHNFTGDLNTMQIAELTLFNTKELQETYCGWITHISERLSGPFKCYSFALAGASAGVRAEAAVRTLGIWRE